MREGYKKTAVGMIPEEWEVVTLGTTGCVVSGGTPKSQIAEFWGREIAWCTPTDITKLDGSKLINHTARGLTNLGLLNCSANLLPSQSLLICTRATIGLCAINTTPMATNQGFKSIIPGDHSVVEFLYYAVLCLRNEMITRSSGSTFLEISKQQFCAIEIPFPPLGEQRKIAAILGGVDEKIAVIDEQIAATEDLKKGLMQKLFSEGIGHSSFKDSPLGPIPVSWEIKQLGDVVSKVGSGVTPKGGQEAYTESGVPFIRSQNVRIGYLKLKDVAYIPRETHEKMSGTQLLCGDVLLNITGASIGRSSVVPAVLKEGNVNQHVCIIRVTDASDSEYLCQYLNSSIGQDLIFRCQAGGNREGLNFQQIRSFVIKVPCVEEQQQIAAILSGVDEKLKIQREKKAAFAELKKGLMQQLLTGAIRVKPEAA